MGAEPFGDTPRISCSPLTQAISFLRMCIPHPTPKPPLLWGDPFQNFKPLIQAAGHRIEVNQRARRPPPQSLSSSLGSLA